MTDVQILIAEMLTENTGIAMMDSGGEIKLKLDSKVELHLAEY